MLNLDLIKIVYHNIYRGSTSIELIKEAYVISYAIGFIALFDINFDDILPEDDLIGH